jgi:hypothetical protein
MGRGGDTIPDGGRDIIGSCAELAMPSIVCDDGPNAGALGVASSIYLYRRTIDARGRRSANDMGAGGDICRDALSDPVLPGGSRDWDATIKNGSCTGLYG